MKVLIDALLVTVSVWLVGVAAPWSIVSLTTLPESLMSLPLTWRSPARTTSPVEAETLNLSTLTVSEPVIRAAPSTRRRPFISMSPFALMSTPEAP